MSWWKCFSSGVCLQDVHLEQQPQQIVPQATLSWFLQVLSRTEKRNFSIKYQGLLVAEEKSGSKIFGIWGVFYLLVNIFCIASVLFMVKTFVPSFYISLLPGCLSATQSVIFWSFALKFPCFIQFSNFIIFSVVSALWHIGWDNGLIINICSLVPVLANLTSWYYRHKSPSQIRCKTKRLVFIR